MFAALQSTEVRGVTLMQFSVFNHSIRVADGVTVLQLASACQVPKKSMTHALSGSEQGRLVLLRPNPEDGRSKRMWLTDEVRLFRNQAIAALVVDFQTIAPQFDINTMLLRIACT